WGIIRTGSGSTEPGEGKGSAPGASRTSERRTQPSERPRRSDREDLRPTKRASEAIRMEFNPYAPSSDERYEAMAAVRAAGGVVPTDAGYYIATAAGVEQ